MRVKRPQFLGDHIGLDRVVPTQRRIGPADDHRLDPDAVARLVVERDPQVDADLARDLRGLVRLHTAGVAEYEEQRCLVAQCLAERFGVPPGEQQATVYRLRPGGVIVDHDDLRHLLLGHRRLLSRSTHRCRPVVRHARRAALR